MTRYYDERHEFEISARAGHQEYYDYDPLPTRTPTMDEIAEHERAEAYARAIEMEVLSLDAINALSELSALLLNGIDSQLGTELGRLVQHWRDEYRDALVNTVEDMAALQFLGAVGVAS